MRPTMLATIALAAGIAASLLKGVDIEEAALLTAFLLLLRRARPAFDRKAALFETRLSPGTLAAVAAAMVASIWLGLFAFKHVEYSDELWWQFALSAEAPRFLRASVGSAIAVLLIAAAQAASATRRTKSIRRREASSTPLPRSSPAQPHASPNLVFLRDKGVLFDDEPRRLRDVRRAGADLGGDGRSRRPLRDCAGSDSRVPRTLRRLRRHAGVLRGTEGPPASLRRLRADVRQARRGSARRSVDLHARRRRRPRDTARRCAASRRRALSFASFRPPASPRSCPQLRSGVGRLARHEAGAEKGFSLGFFDEEYLSRFPVAVIERDGSDSRVRQHLDRARGSERAVGRSDALPTITRRRA